jgi:hypothetical protein
MKGDRISMCFVTGFLTKRTGKHQKKSNTSSEMFRATVMIVLARRRIGHKKLLCKLV